MHSSFWVSKLTLLFFGFLLGLATHWGLSQNNSNSHLNEDDSNAFIRNTGVKSFDQKQKSKQTFFEQTNKTSKIEKLNQPIGVLSNSIGLTRKLCSELEISRYDKMFKDFYDSEESEQEKETHQQKIFNSLSNLAYQSLYWSSDSSISLSGVEYAIQFHLIIFEASDMQNENAIDFSKINRNKLCWRLDTHISKNTQISTWNHIECVSMRGTHKKNNAYILIANNYQTDFTAEVIGALTLAFPFENSQELLWYELKSESWKKGTYSNWKLITKDEYEKHQSEVNSKIDLQSSN